MRLDVYTVNAGLFRSRSQAQQEIKAGAIAVNSVQVFKPSLIIKPSDEVEQVLRANPYVSKGGLKLEKAINVFKLDLEYTFVLDVGSSTGGFTDCALKHGARFVYAVDVGKAQFDLALAKHPHIELFEETNFLHTTKDDFAHVDILVMDVSFTSGIPLISHAASLFHELPMVVLIKPQFESETRVKKGVIRHPKDHVQILENYQKRLNAIGQYIQKITFSPQKGSGGNIEFLALITSNKHYVDMKEIVKEAHEAL